MDVSEGLVCRVFLWALLNRSLIIGNFQCLRIHGLLWISESEQSLDF